MLTKNVFKSMTAYSVLLAMALLVLQVTIPGTEARAQVAVVRAGDLDLMFGNGGKVVTDFGGGDDFAFASAVQPDGKLIVAGTIEDVGDSSSGVVRYDSHGSLDQLWPLRKSGNR